MVPQFLGGRIMRSIIIIALCLIGSAARAASGDVYFLGLGQKSCGAFIAATAGVPPGQYRVIQRQDGEYTNELSRYQQWMMGLASGYNAAHLEDTKLQLNVDIAALDLWMRNWCNKNPTKLLMSAGLAFIDEMMLGH
jgi:hypothetical protein